MDMFWRLEVRIGKHSIGIYSGLFTFLDIYFANVMFFCWGVGQAPSPDPPLGHLWLHNLTE